MSSQVAQALGTGELQEARKYTSPLVLIIIIEICKIGIRISLCCKMWIEVLVSLLQNQVVFVECLGKKRKKKEIRKQEGQKKGTH